MKTLIISILVFLGFCLKGQDLEYVKFVTDTLASPSMHGRGYVYKGDSIAANFIKSEFEEAGLQKFNGTYYQKFNISINTFPEKQKVTISGKELKLAEEYLIGAGSPTIKGAFDVVWLKPKIVNKKKKLSKFISKDYSNKFIVVDVKGVKEKENIKVLKSLRFQNIFNSKGIIFITDGKLIWSVSDGIEKKDFAYLTIKREFLPEDVKKITLDIKSEYIKRYNTQNVIGYVEGKSRPDSFILFTAHYDHLGQLGPDVYYPGGNDNASGTSAVMDLARYFSKPENQPKYSIVFIAYAAEESGLWGSRYFADNPLIQREKIKMVINLDMVGSGSTGIKVVNGQKLTKQFDLLKSINEEKGYLEKVSPRGEAGNSDHYPLYAKGVPAFFIYTTGEECKEYHTPKDTGNVPFTAYEGLFKLLRDFVDEL